MGGYSLYNSFDFFCMFKNFHHKMLGENIFKNKISTSKNVSQTFIMKSPGLRDQGPVMEGMTRTPAEPLVGQCPLCLALGCLCPGGRGGR